MKTPSPHRFLSTNRKAKSTPKEPKAASSLRRELPQPAIEYQSQVQPSQFAQKPRFSHGKAKTSAELERPTSPVNTILVQALRATARPAEDVEESVGTDYGDEMLLDGPDQAELVDEHPDTAQQWNGDLAFSSKRRRINHEDTQLLPVTGASEASSVKGPRFAQSFAQPTQSSMVTDVGGSARPAFVRPTAQPSEPTEPLPDAFSPHRRGRKFIAGGMAATLQQWVLETGQAAVQSRKGQEYLRGEDYVMRVRAEEVSGAGPFVVRARNANGDCVTLLLAAAANTAGSQSKDIRPGCIIGIRAPVWDLDLDSTTYTVGVDWKILS